LRSFAIGKKADFLQIRGRKRKFGDCCQTRRTGKTEVEKKKKKRKSRKTAKEGRRFRLNSKTGEVFIAAEKPKGLKKNRKAKRPPNKLPIDFREKKERIRPQASIREEENSGKKGEKPSSRRFA